MPVAQNTQSLGEVLNSAGVCGGTMPAEFVSHVATGTPKGTRARNCIAEQTEEVCQIIKQLL